MCILTVRMQPKQRVSTPKHMKPRSPASHITHPPPTPWSSLQPGPKKTLLVIPGRTASHHPPRSPLAQPGWPWSRGGTAKGRGAAGRRQPHLRCARCKRCPRCSRSCSLLPPPPLHSECRVCNEKPHELMSCSKGSLQTPPSSPKAGAVEEGASRAESHHPKPRVKDGGN